MFSPQPKAVREVSDSASAPLCFSIQRVKEDVVRTSPDTFRQRNKLHQGRL